MDLKKIATRVANLTPVAVPKVGGEEEDMETLENLKRDWAAAAGRCTDEAYAEQGPDKHEIEDMRTDFEYEVRVVECAATAYRKWAEENPDISLPFDDLALKDQLTLLAIALNETQYGHYRGDVQDPAHLQRAFAELY